jgi:hypothetical protein
MFSQNILNFRHENESLIKLNLNVQNIPTSTAA